MILKSVDMTYNTANIKWCVRDTYKDETQKLESSKFLQNNTVYPGMNEV